MSGSQVLLDYHGQIDLKIIDLLLKKLRNKAEFSNLDTTTRKRVYGVVVECLENIYKNAVTSPPGNQKMLSHILVRKENCTIGIVAGNPVVESAGESLAGKLDRINGLDVAGLKSTYEKIIGGESGGNDNGAGLGLIDMAIKSGNKIGYRFLPLIPGFLYFEIHLSISKYIMRKLIIEKTTSSPKVILDPENKVFLISGESRPPDVREFYNRILSWMEEFGIHLDKTDPGKDPVIFNFNFEYFNSSSGKLILDICKVLARWRMSGFDINIKWHFEKEDTDMLEVGREMSRIVRFPFEFVESGVN